MCGLPVNCLDFLVEFTDYLSEVRAIIEDSEVVTLFILGDSNTSPSQLFGELFSQFLFLIPFRIK